MQEYFINVLRYKYVQGQGRARRKEYWMFVLFNMICLVILRVIGEALEAQFLAGLYYLAVLLPSICLGIRRLHDIGKSGWWLLLALIPLVGGLILLVFFCLDSQPGENQYGPNPKGACVPSPSAASTPSEKQPADSVNKKAAKTAAAVGSFLKEVANEALKEAQDDDEDDEDDDEE